MTFVRLLRLANRGYPDGFLANYFDRRGERLDGHGDTLAQFIVRELRETYNPMAPDLEQLNEAVRVLANAKHDLDGVIDILMRAANNRRRRMLSRRH